MKKIYMTELSNSEKGGRTVLSRADNKRFNGSFEKRRTGKQCWIWCGALNNDAPRFSLDGKQVSAIRLSYEVHKGAIPEGVKVFRECGRKECINPDHLFLATAKQHFRTMQESGFSKIKDIAKGKPKPHRAKRTEQPKPAPAPVKPVEQEWKQPDCEFCGCPGEYMEYGMFTGRAYCPDCGKGEVQ